MFRSVETFIGLRYLRSRQSTRFASFVSAASLLGVAVGVAALITILSVMNGFEAELRSRLLNMQSHGTLTAESGSLGDWSAVRQRVIDRPGIIDATPVVDVEGMINVDGQLIPLIAQGIEPSLENADSGIRQSLVSGSLDDLTPNSRQIILGRYLAIDLGLRLGDSLQLLVPQVTSSGVVPRLQQLTVAGVFDSGVPEYDAGAAYLHWQDAAKLVGKPDQVASLRLLFQNVFDAPIITRSLVSDFGDGFLASDWTQQNASYFRAIKIEKAMMALILSLVIGVAAFNIIASLVMVVTDKETDIAILRTMGLSASSVVRVFLTQGIVIAWLGVFVGVFSGVLLAANVTEVAATLERLLGFQVMPGDVYVMSAIPSEIHPRQVFIIAISALVVTTLATLYPSRRAAAVHPAEALRYG